VRFSLLIDPQKESAYVVLLNESGGYETLSIVDLTISLKWGSDCCVNIPWNAVFAA